jgi:hypothetical protein
LDVTPSGEMQRSDFGKNEDREAAPVPRYIGIMGLERDWGKIFRPCSSGLSGGFAFQRALQRLI